MLDATPDAAPGARLTPARIGQGRRVIAELHPLRPASPVVVASRNRRADLLASLPRHEAPVVLVDNASTDGTVEAVRDRPSRRHRRPAATATRAPVARTVGRRPGRHPVRRLHRRRLLVGAGRPGPGRGAHARPPAAGGCCPPASWSGPRSELDPVCAEMAASPLGTEPDLPGPSLLGFVACAALVRTEAFTAVGGFDPVVRFPGEEERLALDLAAAGWGLAYVDDARRAPPPLDQPRHRPGAAGRRSGAAGCSPR